ncbi:MAG: glycosyltransferase family 2 protein [Planctomycetota bacterium]|jgi:glycosyltransferase involved in cell wall biosynthesis
MKTASIVIPTFNRCDKVKRAIDSALQQTFPCEVVVCDHGSTDRTPQVVAAYGDRVRYVRKEKDQGPIICWHDGIEHATGEIVHLNYDDDWIKPEFLEESIPLLQDNVGFVYTNIEVHNVMKNTIKTLFKHPVGILPMDWIVRYLLNTPLTISPGCAIFRREDILKNLLLEIPGANGVYGKNSGVGEDLLIYLLTSLDYPKYAFISTPLACFLAHETSITVQADTTGRMDHLEDAYSVAKQYYFQQPGHLQSYSGIKQFLFEVQWNQKAGTLQKYLKRSIKRKFRNVRRDLFKAK